MCPESVRESGPPALLRIGELSRRTGVSVDTLRAWERRYGIFEPARSEGGFRLYAQADEERAQAMRGLIAEGLSAAQAASAVREGTRPWAASTARAAVAPDLTARELLGAVERLDEEEANRILDGALAALSFDAVAEGIVLPVLRAIGESWESGELSVGQEHFATNLLRGRLLGFARGWMTGVGPIALLAGPEGESHDLGLIVFGLALRSRGWRIAFLGADTPLESISRTAEAIDAALVVVASLSPEPLIAAREALIALAGRRRVALGGGGAVAAQLDGIEAVRLEHGPVEEAARVAREFPLAPQRPDIT
jgi:DNA-binding transcriptional MerR regulator/methylmalonyl-CoA mutase cobalamin-binding subunit